MVQAMKTRPPPWKRRVPKTGLAMTDEQIARARARAEAAGRRYPNLVDNMAVIREDRNRRR